MDIFLSLLDLIGLAGGGGSSSGGGGGGFSGGSSYSSSSGGSGGSLPGWANLLILGGFFGSMVVVNVITWRRNVQKRRQLQAQLSLSATKDPMWQSEKIKEYAEKVFLRYQADWQNFKSELIRTYTTERYAKHATLMLLALQQMNRQNVVKDIKLTKVDIISASDELDNSQDTVTVQFVGTARDILRDTATKRKIMSRQVSFTEFWNFKRQNDSWRLDSISQSTEAPAMLHKAISDFAAQHNLFYSPDWGNLLLPERGQLFQHSFNNTDINNHTIGFWKNNLLIQLYTYSYTPNSSELNYYLVGQITLPKSYGGIIVERDKGQLGKRWRKPKGYRKISLEWNDFNKSFQVYATAEDQVTSFELLNPAFMAWLYDQNLPVDFEVVDNIVYFYAKVNRQENRYSEMMEILERSFKELRL